MSRPKHTAEQIVAKLRDAQVLQGKGMPLEEAMRQLGISDARYCHEVMLLQQAVEGVR